MNGVLRGPFIAARAFGLAMVVAVLALIEVLIRFDILNPYIVPLPSAVLADIPRVVMDENVPSRFVRTLRSVLAAGALVALFGLPVSLLIYRSRVFRAATTTWIASLAAAPIVLAYPLFLVIFGRNDLTVITIGFVSGFAPFVLKTVEGLVAIRSRLIDVGRVLRLSQWQMVTKILIPAAVPVIFTGMRLALIYTIVTVVAIEFLINIGGLGQLINELAERYDLTGTYVSIICVVLISVLFFVVLERVEAWLRRAPAE